MVEARSEPGREIPRADALIPGGAVREVLKERARLLARPDGQEPRPGNSEPFMAVRVDGLGTCGIPYRFIEELAVVPDITPVPCTPPVIAGIINFRGELLSVLALGAHSRAGGVPAGRQSQVVVVRAGVVMAGLWVDDILGNDVFDPAALAPFPAGPGSWPVHGAVMGIHAGQVAMLDVGALLASPRLCVNEEMKP